MAGGSNYQAGPITRALENLVFGARPVVLLIFAAITVAMLLFASQLRVDAGFKKQIPLEHEYMKTFLDYEADFGGANRVLIAVVAKDGDMFDTSFFNTLEGVTRDVMAIEATDDARARSLFTPNVRFVEVVEDGFAGGNVIPDDFTPGVEGFEGSPEQFQTIRANIVKANIVGRLVAKDWSGAMVWADLIPEDSGTRLDYQAVAQQFEDIRAKYENDQVSVHIIGFAKMVGDISDGARSVIKFFLLTIAFTWLLLFLYSTSAKLASLTVLAAIISVIWMLGALRLMGFGIDPMNMLTPFLIFAIAVSHGEQMINRFRGEIFFGGLEDGSADELRARQGVDPLTAARAAFRMLLVPGIVALVAGCIGFATILMIPIRIIFELAITATVGVAITILTDLILLPVLLSYTRLRNMERKREYRLRQLTRFDRIWALMSKFSKPVPAAVIILVGAASWYFAERMGDRVMIGDAQEGVAELRPEARYNQDARMISTKFALGVDMVNVIAEARPDACTLSYPTMELVDRFAWHLTNVEGVQQVMTLPGVAKIVNAGWNDGSIKWRTLPRDSDSLRLATQGFETDSGLLNSDCSAMPVTAFLADHRAETIDRVVAAVKEFREQNGAWHPGVNLREQLAAEQAKAMEAGEELQNDSVNLRLATGNVGVMAAINDTVRAVEHNILLMLYAAVFVMCLISFRSIFAAFCIVLPLVLVTELGHSLMVKLELGMKINTLTVVALGVGIGVDYAIYIYARMREAMQSGKTLTESYFIALKTTGIAIFYTALTLAVGVAMWIFSELKFQADMGLMLTFMFVVNMFAALIFLPALCRWLLRPTEKDSWTPAA
ncbi:MAG: MMPL family transporter [Chiayiivirga sp.]|jgi:predicted RND superfamily exporter protein|uniref:efflux RND transporter permease subunit n=1 Tax=Chiayiivirga sp. TaxID=2041042 RepID=UPI0025C0D804|nr:MMPL family transporter [Chiayiivirga sp.]MCI1711687.1 MMPL family transporter [Chiayiivirga sp.]MCI1729734.1 MMPL family transporter [Chiayiivirga sp.]